LSDTPAW